MTTPAEQHNQSAEAKADQAKTAIDKPKVTTQSIEEWFKLVNVRTNEIAMNEDLRKEIAKLTK